MVARVAHLVISLAHGGLEQLVVNWTNARNRHHPGSTQVVCLDGPGELAGQVAGGVVTSLDAMRGAFPWDRGAVRRLGGMLRGRVDVVHTHNLAAQQYGALAARRIGVRHVYTQHGANLHNLGVKDRLRARALSAFTDRTVAVSESTARAMQQAQRLPADRVCVVPNGVGPHPGYPRSEIDRLRSGHRIGGGTFVFGSVGRLDRIKGYDRLVRAFGAVTQKVGDALLLIVGDGPERSALEAQAAALDSGPRVVLAGYQAEPRRYLELFDLFVLPSRSEGLSVALLEAMIARCPVAATDAGDNLVVIDGGRAGIALPDDEVAWPGLLQAQTTVAGRKASAERAERARARAEQSYSERATLDAYESVYSGVLAAGDVA